MRSYATTQPPDSGCWRNCHLNKIVFRCLIGRCTMGSTEIDQLFLSVECPALSSLRSECIQEILRKALDASRAKTNGDETRMIYGRTGV